VREEGWNTEMLINFLQQRNLSLDEKDFKILKDEKIDGLVFLDITEERMLKIGLKMGPVIIN